jgi:thioredoxin reductase
MYRLIEANHYINKKILVVGWWRQPLSRPPWASPPVWQRSYPCYRGERFGRIKERNATRIEDCMRTGKVKVLFQSNPLEFTPDSVILDVKGARQEIPNNFVWIFADGTPPNDFLKKIGVGFGAQDLTLAASKEAKDAEASRKEFAQAAAN